MSALVCRASLTLLIAASTSAGVPAQGACWTRRDEVQTPGGVRFGSSLALSGDTLLVGAKSGEAVKVYQRVGNDWLFQQDLITGYQDMQLDLDGDTAVVSEPLWSQGFEFGAGAVYVFRRTSGTWTQEAMLTDTIPTFSVRFGGRVSLFGERLAVADSQGRVHVFERLAQGWTKTRTVASPLYHFAAIELSDLWVGVSFPNFTGFATMGLAGSEVRVYGPSGPFATLGSPLGPDAPDDFGWDLAISGDRIAVGAPALGFTEPGIAAAYVYKRAGNAWSVEATFTVPGAKTVASSVELDGERLAFNVEEPSGAKRIHVYSRSTGVWVEEAQIVPPSGSTGLFPAALSLDGDLLAASDPLFPTAPFPESGKVFVFESDPSLAASVGFRNAGTNPVSYSATPAHIGESVLLTVSPAMSGHSQALVIGFDSPGSLQLAGGQTLLCLDLGGSGELLNTGFSPGPIASFPLSVPNDLGLIGAQVCTQAVHAFGATPFALSNAQDLAIGPPSAACP